MMSRAALPELARTGPVHFMGVGGAGMCALAELLLRHGSRVTGCDLEAGEAVRGLEELGATTWSGHDPAHVDDAVALVVSSAIPGDHPEVRAAVERGLPVMKRAVALGEWVNRSRVLAVAGTHGKTTTTAMATEILIAADLDPTGFVGGRVAAWKGNLRFGGQGIYVVEADEYDRSFHALRPEVAVVTNLEADHLDVYGSLDAVREAFLTFARQVPAGGRVAFCADDPGASRLPAALGGTAYGYGLAPGAQLRARSVSLGQEGSRFRVVEDGRDRGELALRVPGAHNVQNALGAAAAARALGVDWPAVRRGLAAFRGVGRRFQRLGDGRGVVVVDDYAHHPTEIRATLATARAAYPGRTIVAVFQPHLFTRTRDFAREFGEALAEADRIWITDVYPAREDPIPGVTGELVVEAARAASGGDVRYHPELEGLPEALARSLGPGDLCLTLGAGTVERLGPALVDRLRESEEDGSHE